MRLLTCAWPERFTGGEKLAADLANPVELHVDWTDIVTEAVERTNQLGIVRLEWTRASRAAIEWYSSDDLPDDIGGRAKWRGTRGWIVLSDRRLDRDDDYRLTLAMHELGHALHLDHPRADRAGADTLMNHKLKRIGEDKYRPEWGELDVKLLKRKWR